jgi:hypothetical protein
MPPADLARYECIALSKQEELWRVSYRLVVLDVDPDRTRAEETARVWAEQLNVPMQVFE